MEKLTIFCLNIDTAHSTSPIHTTHFFRNFKFVGLTVGFEDTFEATNLKVLLGDFFTFTLQHFANFSILFQPDIVPTFGLQQDLVLIVAPVIGGVLVVAVMFVGFVICVATVKKKRSLHGTYSPQKQEFSAPRFEMTDMSNLFKLPAEERLI